MPIRLRPTALLPLTFPPMFSLIFPLLHALLLTATPASAAPDVQPYGLLSAGVITGTGFTLADDSLTAFSEQGHSSNRWGLRGSEDLGGGNRLRFQLESNLSVRSGAAGREAGSTATQSEGSLFDREANITLASERLGSLKLGRGKNLLYDLADEFDARGNWNFGALKPIARYAGFYSSSGVSRFDSMLRYTSPSLGPLSLDAAYSVGGVPGSSRTGAGYVAGFRLDLSPVEIGYAHGEMRLGDTQEDTNQRVDLLVAKVMVQAWTFNLGYARTRNPTGGGFAAITPTSTVGGRTSADTSFAGAKWSMTERLSFNAGYYDVRDRVAGGGTNDVQMLALGTVYAFSKRTEIYIDAAHARRSAGATAPFTLVDRYRSDARTPSESTTDQTALNIGIQHRF
jgi:predicted porin